MDIYMHREHRLAASALATLLAFDPCMLESDPSLDIIQCGYAEWKIEESFSEGTICAKAQKLHGYLWLDTEYGLLGFDGFLAVPWLALPVEHCRSNFMSSLFVSRNATVWVAIPLRRCVSAAHAGRIRSPRKEPEMNT